MLRRSAPAPLAGRGALLLRCNWAAAMIALTEEQRRQLIRALPGDVVPPGLGPGYPVSLSQATWLGSVTLTSQNRAKTWVE
jgi:hypothetical protein